MNFSQEQVDFIKHKYDIDVSSDVDVYKVRDGYVSIGDKVWWRSAQGPVQVDFVESNLQHFENIKNSPNYYQVSEPTFQISYIYQD